MQAAPCCGAKPGDLPAEVRPLPQRAWHLHEERGLPGEAGAHGAKGETGEHGDPGPPGLRGEPGAAGERGATGDVGPPGQQGPQGNTGLAGAPGERGPIGAPGERGLTGEAGLPGAQGEKGDRGEQGPPGKLPIVKLWREGSVSYAGDVVAYDGATFQATCDTAQTPTGADWICLAVAGRDASIPVIRGLYDAGADYAQLDIVNLNGGSFIAKRDKPGTCPGDGWQLLASQGKRGDKGERGEPGGRGAKGDVGPAGAAAPKFKSWKIDRTRYLATPVMSDGSEGPALELRGLFEQFQVETR